MCKMKLLKTNLLRNIKKYIGTFTAIAITYKNKVNIDKKNPRIQETSRGRKM